MRRAQIRRKERRLGDPERAGGLLSARVRVQSGAPSQKPGVSYRKRTASHLRGAIVAARSVVGRLIIIFNAVHARALFLFAACCRGDQLDHDRVGADAGQRIAHQVVVRRDVLKAVRRYQARAAGNHLFVRRESVNVDADISGRTAVSRSEQVVAVSAGVGHVDDRVALRKIRRVAHLVGGIECFRDCQQFAVDRENGSVSVYVPPMSSPVNRTA